MLDTRFLRASDGTGPAPISRVNTARLPGATVFKVDSVVKMPSAAFIATIGTLNASGYIDPTLAPVNEFRGHLSGSDIILDSWEPGFPNATVDAGNAVNQYIILKQTTGHTNLIQDALAELQAEDVTRQSQNVFDYIQTGGILAGLGYGSTLTASMSAVTAYINGIRATAAAVASRAYTANKDTYVDLLLGGTALAPTLTPVYTEANNNTISPALAANSIRLGVVVTGATNILNAASINQGQETAILPLVSAVSYSFSDGLGNPICPRDPNRRVLTLRQRTSDFTTTSGSAVQIPNFTAQLNNIPLGRKIKVTLNSAALGGGGGTPVLNIWEGAIISGTQRNQFNGAANGVGLTFEAIFTPLTQNPLINIAAYVTTNTLTLSANVLLPSQMRIELV